MRFLGTSLFLKVCHLPLMNLYQGLRDADIVIVGRYGFSEKTFLATRNLKMISVWQTGYDYINIKAATEKGVIVSNVPEYAYDSVAEMVFALILNLARKVHLADVGTT